MILYTTEICCGSHGNDSCYGFGSDSYASVDIAVSAFAENKFPLLILWVLRLWLDVYHNGSVRRMFLEWVVREGNTR
jgi:hypothetical protein